MAKILAFSGSSRKGSFNKSILAIAIQGARQAGAEVTEVDLRDLAMPLYDGDAEAADGLPAGAVKFKELLKAHQGFLIASPEYNSMPSPLLKNAIDWASRRTPGEAPLVCFKGKVAALCAASPGALGGLRGLHVLRNYLMNIQTMVLPGEIAVPAADQALDDSGRLKDAKRQEALVSLGMGLASFLDRQ